MGVSLPAVQEDAVPLLQRIEGAFVFQSSVSGLYQEEQIGGKAASPAGVRLRGFERAGLLQMDEAGLGKVGGGVQDAAGGDQITVKQRGRVHGKSPHFYIFYYYNGKANIMLVLSKILS